MNCEKGKQMLAGWMDDQLTDAERAELGAHLEDCAECRQLFETNRELWVSMGSLPVPPPSEKIQVRFDAMLETFKQGVGEKRPDLFYYLRQLFAVRPGFTWGYSLVLVVVGVGLGYWFSRPSQPAVAEQPLSAQVRELKEMVLLSLLENPSASERIRGVSYTSEIKNVNKKVIDALFSTLNNDPNSNVRLMTLDALAHYADDPAVREGLVQSISQQDSPLVQAALADVMLKLQEKKAVKPFKELLRQKDLNEMVRDKIQQTLTRLI
ncbi:MAG: HEAT repeat domain-containing protein [Bacteroidetes bacterium]|nr:HEAT repeat domain-containing protein [Bacteroidota bacterium]